MKMREGGGRRGIGPRWNAGQRGTKSASPAPTDNHLPPLTTSIYHQHLPPITKPSNAPPRTYRLLLALQWQPACFTASRAHRLHPPIPAPNLRRRGGPLLRESPASTSSLPTRRPLPAGTPDLQAHAARDAVEEGGVSEVAEEEDGVDGHDAEDGEHQQPVLPAARQA